MKYSIIIPTMYFHVEQLHEMLTVYNAIPSVGEILIINNDKAKEVYFPLSKVRTIGNGVNKYVNPSWTFGVKEAKYDNIILANDDITIKGNLPLLLEHVSYLLREGVIIGVGEKCYENKISNIKIVERPIFNKTNMGYGFGVFMCIRKATFLNTPIPDDFLVWYGDHILYYKNKAWIFTGVQITTSMRGTTSKIDLSGFAVKEKRAFSKYLKG